MPFQFKPLSIPDVILIEPAVFGDGRGFFLETYQRSTFRAAGIEAEFVQDNRSRSRQGVLRGLHYQLAPYTQGKLVQVVSGRIWDVAVDVRAGSPTLGKWVGYELTADAHTMLWVPPGFAHGFVVLSETADFVYKCTAEYAPQAERGIRWDDPVLNIAWPVREVSVSSRDEKLPSFADAERL